MKRPLNMGESRELKDDHFESLEAFIRLQCRKIDNLKEMQKNSGAKEPFSSLSTCKSFQRYTDSNTKPVKREPNSYYMNIINIEFQYEIMCHIPAV